jgi:hypothetical protein
MDEKLPGLMPLRTVVQQGPPLLEPRVAGTDPLLAGGDA